MNHKMKKGMAAALCFCMSLNLFACGGPKTPEEVLAATSENMEELDSVAFDVDLTMEIGADQLSFPITMNMEGRYTKEPQRMYSGLTMDLALYELDMEMYAETGEDKSTTYVGIDTGDGVEWGKDTMEVSETSVEDVSAVLKTLKDVKEAEGTETIQDVEVSKYTGILTGEDFKKVAETFAPRGAEGTDEIFGDIKDDMEVPVTLYIDKKECRVIKEVIDLTDAIKDTEESVKDLAGTLISKLDLTVVFSQFNEAEAIEIPKEALEAEEADEEKE